MQKIVSSVYLTVVRDIAFGGSAIGGSKIILKPIACDLCLIDEHGVDLKVRDVDECRASEQKQDQE